MSLLRRIQRNADADSPFGDEPPTPASETQDVNSPIRKLWQHHTDSAIFTSAITHDNRFVIAGTQDGNVLFFDITGRLLWNGRVTGSVREIALAEDTHQFVVGTMLESSKNAYLWHYNGRLLHTLETEGQAWSVDITPDASLIAVGSHDKHVYAFDQEGEQLFKRTVHAAVYGVAVSADGEHVFAAADNNQIVAFDRAGNEQWTFEIDQRPWAGLRIAQGAQKLFAGSNDGHIYCLDFDGSENWRFNTGDYVNVIAVTSDGRHYAAAGNANTVYRLNEQGSVLWEYQTRDNIYGLTLSPDGRYTLIGSNDNTLYLVDHDNDHRVWRNQRGGKVHAAAMTPSGRFFCSGRQTNTLTVFNNTTVVSDLQEIDGPESPILTRQIVQRVRDDYARAPHIGLVRWFTEFERSLRNNQFDVCRALLDEINEEDGSILNETERQYMRSLEGAYWLFRGVAYHRHGRYDEARPCYQQSRAIQYELNNQDGEGQVIAALSLLPEPSPENAEEDEASSTIAEQPLPPALHPETRRLLNEIVQRPRVLGTSEKLLEQRLVAAPPNEQFQIVLLAKNSGYIAPLLQALQADERIVRAAASAALTFLEPGPGLDTLAEMLRSPETFVRWQALRILVDRASEAKQDTFQETKSAIWDAVLNTGERYIDNPLSRREAAHLIAAAGDENDTEWLLTHLNDSDPDMQLAIIEALGAVGDRSALPILKEHENRRAFMGQSTRAAAENAISEIEKRHPLSTVGDVFFSQSDPLANDSVREETIFMTGVETVYAIVTVEHIKPGAQIEIKWLCGDTELHAEVQEINDQQPGNDEIAAIQQTSRQSPPTRPAPFRRRSRPGAPPLPSRPRRRSPFDRDNDNADAPARRPARFGRRETAPARPTDRQSTIRRERPAPQRSRFSRTEADNNAPNPSARRGRDDAPQRSTRSSRPRFDAPSSDRPVPFPTPRRDEARSSRELPRRRSRPRTPRTPHAAPNENINPDAQPVAVPFSRIPRPSGASRRSAPSEAPSSLRPSLGGAQRDRASSGLSLSRDQASERPRFHPRQRYDRRDTTDDNQPRFGRRSSRTDSPFGQRRSSRPRPGRPSRFSRAQRPQLADHARRLVVTLPADEAGRSPGNYHLEIKIDDDTTRRVQFKVLDQIQITGLEPGFAPSPGQQNFAHTSTFLSAGKYIDCRVHLQDAPHNLLLTGKIYNATTGTLVQQTTANARHEGDQAVSMTWEQPWWQPGAYRIEVFAEHSNTANTEIAVIPHYTIQEIALCHALDANNGPIGTDWPFYPDDTCYCVVELGSPPPGIEIEVTWHQKNGTWKTVKPEPRSLRRRSRSDDPQRYTTTTDPNQRATFKLQPPQNQRLTPGYYSVVIAGPSVTRGEKTFEVHAYPLGKQLQETLSKARSRIEPTAKRHNLKHALAVLGMVMLVALGMLLLNTGTSYVAGSHRIDTEPVLDIARALNHVNTLWVVSWLALGVGYGLLFSRYKNDKSSDLEEKLFVLLNTLLVFFSTVLIGHQFSYLAFGPTYLWPGTLWRLLENLQWVNPVSAWLTVPAALVFVEIARQDDHEWPFYIAPFWVVVSIGTILLTCYGGALLLGLSAGLVGVIIGSPLSAVGVSNDLGHAFLHVAGNIGFVTGPLIAALIYWREDLLSFWESWKTRRSTRRRNNFTLLHYLAEDNAALQPLTTIETLAQRARRITLLMIGMLLLVLALFEPVVVPTLETLYILPNNSQIAEVLRTARMKPALGLALVLAWPALIYGAYNSVVTLGLPVSVKKTARRFAWTILFVPLVALITVWIASSTAPHHNWPITTNLYWINRAAVAAVSVLIIFAAHDMYQRIPTQTRRELVPELSWDNTDDIALLTLGLVIFIAVLLLPLWMWSLMILTTFGTTATGITIARRIK